MSQEEAPDTPEWKESLAGRAYRLCIEGHKAHCLLRRLLNLLHFWKIDYCAGRHYADIDRLRTLRQRQGRL